MERRTLLSAAAGASALIGVGATVLSKDVRDAELSLLAAPAALVAEHRLEAEFLNRPQEYYAGKVAEACKGTYRNEVELQKLCEAADALEAAGHKKASITLNLLGADAFPSTNAFIDTWAQLKMGKPAHQAYPTYPPSTEELEQQLKEFNEIVDFEDVEAKIARESILAEFERKRAHETSPKEIARSTAADAYGLFRDLDASTRNLVIERGLSVAEAARVLGLAGCEEDRTCKEQGEADLENGQYIDAARSLALAEEASTDPDEKAELAQLQSEAWLAEGMALLVDPRRDDALNAHLDFFIGGWRADGVERSMDIERTLNYVIENPDSDANLQALGSLYSQAGDCARAQTFYLESLEVSAWKDKADRMPHNIYNVSEIGVSAQTYARMATCLAE